MVIGRLGRNTVWPMMKELYQMLKKEREIEPTKKEWRKAWLEKSEGHKGSTFYDNFDKAKKRGEIRSKYDKDLGKWLIVLVEDAVASKREIGILLDEMGKGHKKSQEVAAKEFARLCKNKTVTYSQNLETFFQEMLGNQEYPALQTEILRAMKNIISLCIENEDIQTAKNLYEQNEDAIKTYAREKIEGHMPRTKLYAMEIMGMVATKKDEGKRALLGIIYDILQNSSINDFIYFEAIEGHIHQIIKDHLQDLQESIERQLFAIAERRDVDERIGDRALRLLQQLRKNYQQPTR